MRGAKYPVTGFVLAAVGLLATIDLFLPRQQRIISDPTGLLIVLGPALLIGGLVLCARRFASDGGGFFHRTVLTLGVLMLAAGGFPWIYTPYLTGDRPGGEAAGMIGTIIFLLVGLPGLVLTVIGFRGFKEGR